MSIEQAAAFISKLNLSPRQLQAFREALEAELVSGSTFEQWKSASRQLLQDIRANPETYRRVIEPAAAKPGDLSWYQGADVWIEVGHHYERGGELRIALKESPFPDYADFWVPFSAPAGGALGWLRFIYVTSIREVSVFAATEWRPASEPAPAQQVRLPLPLSPLPVGFLPDQ